MIELACFLVVVYLGFRIIFGLLVFLMEMWEAIF
jgi:hypothetical protein